MLVSFIFLCSNNTALPEDEGGQRTGPGVQSLSMTEWKEEF